MIELSNANYSMLMTIVGNFIFAFTYSYSKMIKEQILISFGKNVQLKRKSLNLSQEQLAELAGLHRTYIGMIERAEKNITLLNIKKIADALKVTISELLQ